MYNFWKNNKNVILIAVSMFAVSVTVLLFFLTEEHGVSSDLTANVINSTKSSVQEQTEQDYRNKFASNNEPFIVLGLDGKIDFASWDYQEFSGYKTEELEDQMVFALVDPADLPMLVASFGEVVASEDAKSMVGPYKIKNKDGELRTHIASLYPLVEGDKVIGIIFSPKDITEAIDTNETTKDNSEVKDESLESDTEEASEEVEDTTIDYGPKIKEINFEEADSYSEEATLESENADSDNENKAKKAYDLLKEQPQKEETEKNNNDNPEKPETDQKENNGKMIRNTENKDENRLVVNKLAKVFSNNNPLDLVLPNEPTLSYWYPYLQL